MSIKTTHQVTREFALAAIAVKLQSATDEQLEDILEEAIHNGFYNFVIVDKLDSNYILDDITDLPEYNDAY